MKVYGDIRLQVDINKEQQYEITNEFIKKILNYPERCFIDDKGNLVETWEDGGGSHSWTEEKILRKATKQDKLYIEFKNMLWEAYRKSKSKN